ncbi:hypothetical protein X747_31825 [Mesorhizobium sp. LNJC384A00]|nr:hypothetical protein X747_31825 [Mesorhizobium sp. LNJC384A00]
MMSNWRLIRPFEHAQLDRAGVEQRVHCKSLPPQEVRALLTTRKLLQSKRHDVEMSIRGVFRGFVSRRR